MTGTEALGEAVGDSSCSTWAIVGRSVGDLASMRRTKSSSTRGTSGRSDRRLGGDSLRIWARSTEPLPEKGGCPATDSNSTKPSE
jgi:hypothetical protein